MPIFKFILVLAIFSLPLIAAHGQEDSNQAPPDQGSSDAWDLNSHHEYVIDKTQGIYGQMQKSGMDSHLMTQQSAMHPEEQSEILKTMFEGDGSQTNRIITQQMPASGAAAGPRAGHAAPWAAGYYDRLSRANLTGYSPQLQALQSQLNAQAVPGAPRLIETGKLDYATLSYPSYALSYDLKQLQQRLALQESALQAKGLSIDPILQHRREILEKAQKELQAFTETAAAAKNPAQISHSLLKSLSDKQKEASRWITDAALQEEMERLESEKTLFSPELRLLIASAPADAQTRTAYMRRGQSYINSLSTLEANNKTALGLLESPSWINSMSPIADLLGENARLKKNLNDAIKDYVRTPFMLDSLAQQNSKPSLFDSVMLWLMPQSGYAQKEASRQSQIKALTSAFFEIASGDLAAAHASLAAFNP